MVSHILLQGKYACLLACLPVCLFVRLSLPARLPVSFSMQDCGAHPCIHSAHGFSYSVRSIMTIFSPVTFLGIYLHARSLVVDMAALTASLGACVDHASTQAWQDWQLPFVVVTCHVVAAAGASVLLQSFRRISSKISACHGATGCRGWAIGQRRMAKTAATTTLMMTTSPSESFRHNCMERLDLLENRVASP